MSKVLVDRFFSLGYEDLIRLSQIFLGNACWVKLESRSSDKVVLVGGGFSLTVEKEASDNFSVAWEVFEDPVLGGRVPRFISREIMTQFLEGLGGIGEPSGVQLGHQVLCPHCGELTGLGGSTLLMEAFSGRGNCYYCGKHVWFKFVGVICPNQASCKIPKDALDF